MRRCPQFGFSRASRDPEGATRDAAIRTQLIAQLSELIEGSDALTDYKRGELRGKIAAKPAA